MGPLQPVLDGLEAQRHRRFIKSHLAADGLRFFPRSKYIVVGRDTRDVFMSLFNHYSSYTDMMFELFNDPDRPGPAFPRCPATPRELWPRWVSEGWFEVGIQRRLAILVTSPPSIDLVGDTRAS